MHQGMRDSAPAEMSTDVVGKLFSLCLELFPSKDCGAIQSLSFTASTKGLHQMTQKETFKQSVCDHEREYVLLRNVLWTNCALSQLALEVIGNGGMLALEAHSYLGELDSIASYDMGMVSWRSMSLCISWRSMSLCILEEHVPVHLPE